METEAIIADIRSHLRLLEGNQRALVNRVCALEEPSWRNAPTRPETPEARKANPHRDADVVEVREQYRMWCGHDEALRDAWEAGQRHALAELGIEIQEDDGDH